MCANLTAARLAANNISCAFSSVSSTLRTIADDCTTVRSRLHLSAMRHVRPERRCLRARDGVEIEYFTAGTGLPVLLVNGLGAGWRIWRKQIEYLADRYRFITWNYRGLYRNNTNTAVDSSSLSVHAEDALEILAREGIERAATISWSMGVHVSLELFRKAPERVASLILIGGPASELLGKILRFGLTKLLMSPLASTAIKAPKISDALARMAVASPEVFAWAKRVGLVGHNLDEEHFVDLVSCFSDLNVKVLQRTFAYLAEHDTATLLDGMDVPMLVIAGDRDPFTSLTAVERIVNEVNGAELMVVPGANHYLAADYPDYVNLRIEKFFKERGYTRSETAEA
jgi:pimeloyl-ACP methyl ester carboxylesterase